MTLQLESFDNLLIDKSLQESLGTWTDFSSIFSEILIEPVPVVGEKLLSTILTFLLPERGR